MKRMFEIEYPDDCGPMWMNVDNLAICLRTKEFIGPKVKISVRDVTDEVEKTKEKAWQYDDLCR